MEIKKVLNLSKDEFECLCKAGELLGKVKRSLESKEADELSTESKDLLNAILTVVTKIVE